MFSRRVVVMLGVVLLAVGNLIFLSYTSRRQTPPVGIGGIALTLVAPFQEALGWTLHLASDTWRHYFNLVATARQNDRLQVDLRRAEALVDHCRELELANERLRQLLNFKTIVSESAVTAEVIGRDPSAWSRTLIIDKGSRDQLRQGQPVVVPEGIAGQVIEVAPHYAKVLLIIDPNNAVDSLVQRSRARGIVKGGEGGSCLLDYALRKDEIRVGDTIVTSGLDGVYPKGLRVGSVTSVIRRHSGMFQDVVVSPFVDFEKIEEVLVIPGSPRNGGAMGEPR
jgi:rod shape-determining protein MreC